jgi:hypothetical protein
MNIYLFLFVHWYFNWQGSIEPQLRCGAAVNDTLPDDLLKCSLEDSHECLQRAQEDKEKLVVEVKCLKTELQNSKAQAAELSKTVNDMKQVSVNYTFLASWLLFLHHLSFCAVIFWLAVMIHIWQANSLNLDLETEHRDCSTCIMQCSSLCLDNSVLP